MEAPLDSPPPAFSHPSWGKGFSPFWNLVGLAQSRLQFASSAAPRSGGKSLSGGERYLLPSLPSFPRPCPWMESGAWSPAALPLRPRARRLGAAAPPAHRTWARKGEWPAGDPRGWRPLSLSATRSTTHCPLAGVRAEWQRQPRPALEAETTDWTALLKPRLRVPP